jgi:hypothetical protein
MSDLLNSFVKRETNLELVFRNENFVRDILSVLDGNKPKEVLERYIDIEYIKDFAEKHKDNDDFVGGEYINFINEYNQNNILEIIRYFGIEGHVSLFERFIENKENFLSLYESGIYGPILDQTYFDKIFSHYKIDVKDWAIKNQINFSDIHKIYSGGYEEVSVACEYFGIKTKESWRLPGKIYSCKICSESYRNEFALSLHMKENHENNN